jgi:molybdenum cofactor cytidylyltransferase
MAAERPAGLTTGLVLAAGRSSRLGVPKQLLAYRGATLLDCALQCARACPFDQRLCVLGAAAEQIRATVDLSGFSVVENHAAGEGCSSSIAAALRAVDPSSDVLVLMLGDQPGVRPEVVGALVGMLRASGAPAAACDYEDARGHPLAFGRQLFDQLGALHGDRGVWRLLEGLGERAAGLAVAGRLPPDVDTWEDYREVLAS